MSEKRISNLAASVHRRLLNLAREKGEDLQFVLDRYAAERLLYRLSVSEYRDRFVLKGAALLAVWSKEAYRATRDVDLLSWGVSSPESVEPVFRGICRISVDDDGLRFLEDSIVAQEIQEAQEYGGIRVRMSALLGRARANVQIDVGFGDAVTPEPEEIEFGGMLGFPPAALRGYPRESVIAEKLHAMVTLGIANSRMKDFYDLLYMSRQFDFDGRKLCDAIAATFERRQTTLPRDAPTCLTAGFYEDREKLGQWSAFIRRSRIGGADAGLSEVCLALREFLLPPMLAAAEGAVFDMFWPSSGPWSRRE